MTAYTIDWAGNEAWDLFTRSGRFAGIIVAKKNYFKLYFNGSCTKGSARKFATFNDAANYMHERRIKRGFATK